MTVQWWKVKRIGMEEDGRRRKRSNMKKIVRSFQNAIVLIT